MARSVAAGCQQQNEPPTAARAGDCAALGPAAPIVGPDVDKLTQISLAWVAWQREHNWGGRWPPQTQSQDYGWDQDYVFLDGGITYHITKCSFKIRKQMSISPNILTQTEACSLSRTGKERLMSCAALVQQSGWRHDALQELRFIAFKTVKLELSLLPFELSV